jgi:hypothetical protein
VVGFVFKETYSTRRLKDVTSALESLFGGSCWCPFGVRRENFSLEEVVPMSNQVQLLCLQATEELADSN